MYVWNDSLIVVVGQKDSFHDDESIIHFRGPTKLFSLICQLMV